MRAVRFFRLITESKLKFAGEILPARNNNFSKSWLEQGKRGLTQLQLNEPKLRFYPTERTLKTRLNSSEEHSLLINIKIDSIERKLKIRFQTLILKNHCRLNLIFIIQCLGALFWTFLVQSIQFHLRAAFRNTLRAIEVITSDIHQSPIRFLGTRSLLTLPTFLISMHYHKQIKTKRFQHFFTIKKRGIYICSAILYQILMLNSALLSFTYSQSFVL